MNAIDHPADAARARAVATPIPSAGAIVFASSIAMAVAMGIGRFAFTPIMPMMIGEGALDLDFAGTLAAINYGGYLLGALLCMALPAVWSSVTLVRCGLIATVLLTLAMMIPSQTAWIVLRFVIGIFSAITFVHTARWCLTLVAEQGKAALGAMMFVGVGVGIALLGVATWVMIGLGLTSRDGWLCFAIMGAGLVAMIWRTLRGAPAMEPVVPRAATGPAPARDNAGEMTLFAFAYGLAGFGYIITATFLPVIARASLPPTLWVDLFWPILGICAAIGSILSTRVHMVSDPRTALTACYFIQAAGIGLTVLVPTVPGFIIGSALTGLPFLGINYFAMQEVRRLRPHQAARYMGLLTALFGIGQIVGPPLVTVIQRFSATERAGFDQSLEIAAGALVLGGILYILMEWVWPGRPARRR
ncbi:YbfB/YjiJ family MFS transporter [Acuticoccus kandeliae]|uniref:YbfB/YjiJ family MFS transporter n=1 Tax=Acuticoccus kandeliae TaxID=2073160 RepID=UPI000D3E8A97|nr:YbfB/YjiJ family MFS transporter [Acuticoccus kandeliae]